MKSAIIEVVYSEKFKIIEVYAEAEKMCEWDADFGWEFPIMVAIGGMSRNYNLEVVLDENVQEMLICYFSRYTDEREYVIKNLYNELKFYSMSKIEISIF